MGKVRRSPHLLEAFHAARMGEGPDAGPAVHPGVRPPEAGGAGEGPLEVTLGESACLVLRFSAGVLAAVVLVGLALVLGAFLLGRLTAGGEPRGTAAPTRPAARSATPAPGSRSRRAALPSAVSPKTSRPAGGETQPATAAATPVYTVQVAVYGSGKVAQAEELKTFLLSKGIPDVTVVQIGNQYRVCVGRFPSADDEGVKLALRRVRELGPEFRTAFVNRLP